MKVHAVEIVRLELELVCPLGTSAGTHDRRPLVLVHLATDVGEGWGECEALAGPHYSDEFADGAEQVLLAWLAPLLLEGEPRIETAEDALELLAAVRGHAMAKAALEMALLDAELRAAGSSLASRLGATRTTVVAGAAVGIGSPDAVVADVAAVVEAGFTQVKCKIAPGVAVEQVRAVRSSFPRLAVSVDANGSYRADAGADLDELAVLDELELAAIEQPFAPDDLVGHAGLVRSIGTPVLLDESVTGPGALESALALGACSGISLKSARVGGVLAARRLHDRCVDEGLHLASGGMLEAGLGRACSLAVAALPGMDLGGDLGPSNRYFLPDVTAEHVLVSGVLAVPSGPGIGAQPRASVLGAAVRTTTLRAGRPATHEQRSGHVSRST
ncbi:MAG: o-succinylbenzoate synthase [Acidimicrobiales bacterium]